MVFQQSIDDKKKYPYASAFLTVLFKRNENQNEHLYRSLFGFVRLNAMECFGRMIPENDSTGAHHVHPRVLSTVLERILDAYIVVRCLQSWFSHENNIAENRYSDEDKSKLIEIARNVDLKQLSTKKLSTIEPCSLFSSERFRQAFVHHCKDEEIVTETPKTSPRLQVFGAGMEYLNGHYINLKLNKQRLNAFYRRVEYNGSPCTAIIHHRQSDNKWLVSIVGIIPNNNGGQPNDLLKGTEVDEAKIQIHLFESTLSLQDPKTPPYRSWKCIEGIGPTLLVGRIYGEKHRAKT